MFNSADQITSTARNSMTSQLNLATSLTGSMLESMEKFMGLNLQAAKATVENSINNAQHLMLAKDPQEFFATSAQQAQPQTDIVLTYARHLATIASGAHFELSKVAESQISESGRNVTDMINELSKHAPAGSENMISTFKSVIDNTSSGFSQLNRTAKAAVEAMESNVNAASSQIAQATAKTSSRSKK